MNQHSGRPLIVLAAVIFIGLISWIAYTLLHHPMA